MTKLMGNSLAGGSPTRGRVENDFYATPDCSTEAILSKEYLFGEIWEPACGNGAISKLIEKRGKTVISTDLIDRGYGKSPVDFLAINPAEHQVDCVITNPPFSLAQEFIEQALKVARHKVLMFCKIQLLEGKARKTMFKTTPLKKVYVFSERQNPLRNGEQTDVNGKEWASTMCFAWFVWEKGYTGNPQIEWI